MSPIEEILFSGWHPFAHAVVWVLIVFTLALAGYGLLRGVR